MRHQPGQSRPKTCSPPLLGRGVELFRTCFRFCRVTGEIARTKRLITELGSTRILGFSESSTKKLDPSALSHPRTPYRHKVPRLNSLCISQFAAHFTSHAQNGNHACSGQPISNPRRPDVHRKVAQRLPEKKSPRPLRRSGAWTTPFLATPTLSRSFATVPFQSTSVGSSVFAALLPNTSACPRVGAWDKS